MKKQLLSALLCATMVTGTLASAGVVFADDAAAAEGPSKAQTERYDRDTDNKRSALPRRMRQAKRPAPVLKMRMRLRGWDSPPGRQTIFRSNRRARRQNSGARAGSERQKEAFRPAQGIRTPSQGVFAARLLLSKRDARKTARRPERRPKSAHRSILPRPSDRRRKCGDFPRPDAGRRRSGSALKKDQGRSQRLPLRMCPSRRRIRNR